MSMGMSESDRAETIARYQAQYLRFGYSPKALGWDKGRQDIRFEVLTSFFDCRGKSVLDLGCGFGDLNRVLHKRYGDEYRYVGIDLLESLIHEGRKRYPGDHIRFVLGDLLQPNLLDGTFDIVIASGVFNHKFETTDNYAFIAKSVDRAFAICREGIAFDFLSDKVDFRHAHTFHSSPERILAMAYEHSRNVVLRNDYMPFEFSLCIAKDESFPVAEPVFHRFVARQEMHP